MGDAECGGGLNDHAQLARHIGEEDLNPGIEEATENGGVCAFGHELVEDNGTAARAEYTLDFADAQNGIRDHGKDEVEDNGVEGGIGEFEVVGVHGTGIDGDLEVRGPADEAANHGGGEVDGGEMEARRE